MTPNTKSILDEIIRNQEGGWVLTQNVNDPDGGWTYGGMTKKTFCSVSRGWVGYTYSQIEDVIAQGDASKNGLGEVKTDFMKDAVLQAYEQIFIIPSRVEEFPIAIQFAYLSCAINRGVENAVRALQMACNACCIITKCDGIIGSATIASANATTHMTEEGLMPIMQGNLLREFCHAWRLQYADLVVENAEAWHAYIADVTGLRAKSSLSEPSLFRAPDLIGWLNRVHYCEAR